MFSCKSLAAEIKASRDRQKGFDENKKNEETIEVPRSFLDIVDKLFAGDICPEFNGFVAEHDKVDKSNNYNFLNNSEDFVFDKPDKNEIDFWNVLTVLIEIIVVLILNFFFNWKGPNSWKAQAMVKVLKLCTPNERKYLVSNMDESISDTQTIVDFKYKFNFLRYAEIKPDWWIHKNQQKYNSSEASNSCQNINNCGESISKILDAMQIDNEYSKQSINRSYEEIINDGIDDESLVSGEFNSDDEDVTGNITTESKIDIETDPNRGWSSKLTLFNLLTELQRDGISIHIVFFGILHLASEGDLKLFQEHCTINDMEETFIAKPMKYR
ncbi:hypothetical protein QTP88_027259 [Uroleucon formosanum]